MAREARPVQQYPGLRLRAGPAKTQPVIANVATVGDGADIEAACKFTSAWNADVGVSTLSPQPGVTLPPTGVSVLSSAGAARVYAWQCPRCSDPWGAVHRVYDSTVSRAAPASTGSSPRIPGLYASRLSLPCGLEHMSAWIGVTLHVLASQTRRRRPVRRPSVYSTHRIAQALCSGDEDIHGKGNQDILRLRQT